MKWPKRSLNSLGPFLSALILMCCSLSVNGSSLVDSTPSTTIDVCREQQQWNSSTGDKNVTVVVPPDLTGTGAVHVLVEHCVFNNRNVIIEIVPTAHRNSTTTTRIQITVRHVVMRGGSFVIKPQLHQQGVDSALACSLHHVAIDVEDVDMQVYGDVLVVDADECPAPGSVPDATDGHDETPTLSHVSLTVRHAVVTSTHGDVATFIAPHNASVHGLHIFIGTNTTMTTFLQFVASVVASRFVDVSLAVHSGGDSVGSTTCRGGPVVLRAGTRTRIASGSNAMNGVSILSLGPTKQLQPSQQLALSDVAFSLTDGVPCSCSLNKITVEVFARLYSFVASVFVHSVGHASLNMTASVSVIFRLSNTVAHEITLSAMSFTSVGSITLSSSKHGGVPLQVANCSLVFSFSSEGTPEQGLSSGTDIVHSSRYGSSALFALVVSAFPDESRATFIVDNSNMSWSVDLFGSKHMVLATRSAGITTLRVFFGVHVTCRSTGALRATFELINNSTINIAPRFSNVTNVTVSGASSVFAVVLSSYFLVREQGYYNHLVFMDVDSTSSISITASIAQHELSHATTRIITAEFQRQDYGSNALLGISISSLQSKKDRNLQVARFRLDGKLKIGVELLGNVVLQSSTGPVVGLALNAASTRLFANSSRREVLQVALTMEGSQIHISGANGVVAGVSASTEGISPSNTNLTFCHNPSAKLPETQSVLLGIEPPVNKLSFNHLDSDAPGCKIMHDQVTQNLAFHHNRCFTETPTDTESHSETLPKTHSMSLSALFSTSRTETSSNFPVGAEKTESGEAAAHVAIETASSSHSTTTTPSSTSTLQIPSPLPTPPPSPTVFRNNTVHPSNSPILSQKTTVTVVSSTVLVTSAINSGGPGLQDVQALVVLGSMACATEEVQTISSGGEKSVVPFELPVLEEGSRARTMASNVVVLLAVVLAQALVAVTIKAKKDKNFVEACGLARFPAWSFSAFVLLYQGTILTAFRGLCSPSTSTDRILGAVLVIVSLTVPLIAPILRLRDRWPATFVLYESAFKEAPKMLRQFVLPVGFYDGSPSVDPECIVRRFSTFFTAVNDGAHPLFITIGFVKAFLVALIAALPVDAATCTTRFALIGAVSLAVVAVVGRFRPYRVTLNNVLSVLSNLCTAALCFASVKPEAIKESHVSSIVTVTAGLGFLTSVSGVAFKLLEYTRWKRAEKRHRASTEDEKLMLNIPLFDDGKASDVCDAPARRHTSNPLLADDDADEDDEDSRGSLSSRSSSGTEDDDSDADDNAQYREDEDELSSSAEI